MVKVGYIKLGNLGISQVVDLILDERADRDIDIRTIGTGAKMGVDEAKDAVKLMEWDPDLVVIVSPNASLPGPTTAREAVGNRHCIVISDAPTKKIKDELTKEGFGYIILNGDPLIGARREFLDPAEMALFNSDVLKTLAVSGAVRLVQEEIDRVIGEISTANEVKLPQIVASSFLVTERARFSNPYARAKAIAAYSLAEKVADMNMQACFALREPDKYIPMASAAHEVMRAAAKLADEAREIEKEADKVSRRPHSRSGEILSKTGLQEKLGK
jgi:methylenetetrahydromethanopterin dehydrogenase